MVDDDEKSRFGRQYTIYMKGRDNDFLRTYAHDQGITAAQAVRRALRLLQVVTDVQKGAPNATLFVRDGKNDIEIKIIL